MSFTGERITRRNTPASMRRRTRSSIHSRPGTSYRSRIDRMPSSFLSRHGERVVEHRLDAVEPLVEAHPRLAARAVVQRAQLGQHARRACGGAPRAISRMRSGGSAATSMVLLRRAPHLRHQPLLEQAREHVVGVGATDAGLGGNVAHGRLTEFERGQIEPGLGLLQTELNEHAIDATIVDSAGCPTIRATMHGHAITACRYGRQSAS